MSGDIREIEVGLDITLLDFDEPFIKHPFRDEFDTHSEDYSLENPPSNNTGPLEFLEHVSYGKRLLFVGGVLLTSYFAYQTMNYYFSR